MIQEALYATFQSRLKYCIFCSGDKHTELTKSSTTYKGLVDLPDEDSFADPGLFEVPSNLQNVSDVHSGRDASNPTSEENKRQKSIIKRNRKRVVGSFSHKSNRGYIVDSGTSFHLVTENSLSKKQRASIREIDVANPIITANGEVVITHQCQVFVQELGIFVWAYM